SVGQNDLLEHEFKLLRELSVTGIPRALEFLHSDGADKRVWSVMEDGGGSPLTHWLTSDQLGLDLFFKFAIHLSKILADLHRQNIIVRNLNPRGMLVDPATGEVWLTDLSLAVRTAGEIQEPLPQQLLRGMLDYASPEQTGRMNRATDYRTDF